MPYARPPYSQLLSDIQSDLGATSLLRFSNTQVIGKVQAKVTNGLYGYADYIALQSNPFTSSGEYLAAWGALKDVFLKSATSAVLQVAFSGTQGETISAGLACTRADGVAYTTTTSAEIGANGPALVDVEAVDPGSAGNATAGVAITLDVAIAGVTSAGAVVETVTPGTDVETQPQFKTRVLAAYQQPPQGGSPPDYIRWALEATGVTRAWLAKGVNGPGTLGVYVMLDDAEAAEAGFPQGANGVATLETRDAAATGDQLSVANYLWTLQGSGATVYVFAPIANTINITLSGLSAASAATKAAINSALVQLALDEGSVGGTIQLSTTDPTPGEIQLSDINGAIGSIAGSSGYVIEAMTASNGAASPTSNVTSSFGCLPVFAAVNFV